MRRRCCTAATSSRPPTLTSQRRLGRRHAPGAGDTLPPAHPHFPAPVRLLGHRTHDNCRDGAVRGLPPAAAAARPGPGRRAARRPPHRLPPLRRPRGTASRPGGPPHRAPAARRAGLRGQRPLRSTRATVAQWVDFERHMRELPHANVATHGLRGREPQATESTRSTTRPTPRRPHRLRARRPPPQGARGSRRRVRECRPHHPLTLANACMRQ